MDNLPTWANIFLAYIMTSLVFHFIYLIDRRTRKEGLLFTLPPSAKSRMFAFLISILLGCALIILGIVGYLVSYETVILAIAAITLFAYSLGMDRPLAQIQNDYARTFHTQSVKKRKQIIGIKQMSPAEITYKVRNGARFVIFEYCISPLVVTLNYDSDIYFLEPNEDPRKHSLRFILITLFFGWFSLFGPINTIQCLLTNIRGGKDITNHIVNWLNQFQE